jgi:hypothetical protein
MPDDPFIVDMDPIKKMWMFNNWIEDQSDTIELAKNHAYLLGSFWNPEAVSKLVDSGNTYKSTDEDLEKSMEIVKKDKQKYLSTKDNKVIKRRRRNIKG